MFLEDNALESTFAFYLKKNKATHHFPSFNTSTFYPGFYSICLLIPNLHTYALMRSIPEPKGHVRPTERPMLPNTGARGPLYRSISSHSPPARDSSCKNGLTRVRANQTNLARTGGMRHRHAECLFKLAWPYSFANLKIASESCMLVQE